MSAQACKNCHFSKPSGVDFRVECRRFPPSVSVSSLSAYIRFPPLVAENDWCGEWRAHGHRPPQVEPETAQERMFKWFWR